MLDLNDLAEGRIPAITAAAGRAMAEAAGVCLEDRGHTPGVALQVRGIRDGDYSLAWPAITEQARRAWGDLQDATEQGAYGIAALLAKPETGYEVIRRSHKGTRFDYWLGDVLAQGFQDKAKLEISGILSGDARAASSRAREKLLQTRRSSELSLPAYAIVVEFSRPLAEVRKDEQP